jgi:hypothetical protein
MNNVRAMSYSVKPPSHISLLVFVIQALGPLGLNMADFCKQFNERTKTFVASTPTPVSLSAFNNRTFTFETKTPPTRCVWSSSYFPPISHPDCLFYFVYFVQLVFEEVCGY